jgi:malate dehydrogenase (oxaloacetate-decarboxylating)
MNTVPNPSYSFTLRLEIENKVGMLAKVMAAIGNAGGDIGAVDIAQTSRDTIVRDITVATGDEAHAAYIVDKVKEVPGIRVVNVSDRTFLMHLGGKISVNGKFPIKTRDQLSQAYTPGVARICNAIAEDKNKAFTLTMKSNTVAIVTDGSAVLGLGNIGPEAALPVMEGKAMLFKEFAGVDGIPICLATQDTEKIVEIVKALAPGFGGINLEDISAPRCFEIERRLIDELDIPVMHDDQHGTAVVVLAALLNALKLTGKKIEDIKLVVVGLGAAGTACAKIIAASGCRNIVGVDLHGAVYRGMPGHLTPGMLWFAEHTNPNLEKGSLAEVIRGADVFLGLSGPGVLKEEYLQSMNAEPIVFALANPTPEIMPEVAAPYVSVMATGRSDYPNQINNVLSFPGIFRGALECRARRINEEMKIAAARAIQNIISPEELIPDYIIPSVFDSRTAPAVAKAVTEAAYATGVARRER